MGAAQVAVATLAFNIATMLGASAAAAADAEHIAVYRRALVREQRGQCSKADVVSLFKDAHRCGCEPFDSETFGGGGGRRSILYYEERRD